MRMIELLVHALYEGRLFEMKKLMIASNPSYDQKVRKNVIKNCLEMYNNYYNRLHSCNDTRGTIMILTPFSCSDLQKSSGNGFCSINSIVYSVHGIDRHAFHPDKNLEENATLVYN